MDIDEVNRHRRATGLQEHCAYPSSFRKDDPPRQSLWKVTIRFQDSYKRDADKRCGRYNRTLRDYHDDWSMSKIPDRGASINSMYEAWFLVEGSKLQSFEEMLRLDIIKGGLHDYRVELFATV